MKTSTYGIIGFLLLIVLVDAGIMLGVASTGKPRPDYGPYVDEVVEPEWPCDTVVVDVETVDETPVEEVVQTPAPEVRDKQEATPGKMVVEVDMPMVLVMPEGSESARPLDGTVYDADTLVIISRTHSLKVK